MYMQKGTCLELMRVTGDEDVDTQLPLQDCECLFVPPRHNLRWAAT